MDRQYNPDPPIWATTLEDICQWSALFRHEVRSSLICIIGMFFTGCGLSSTQLSPLTAYAMQEDFHRGTMGSRSDVQSKKGLNLLSHSGWSCRGSDRVDRVRSTLKQQNLNGPISISLPAYFPSLSLTLVASFSVVLWFVLPPCSPLNILSPLLLALCVNFRRFCGVGLSWHEIGLAKDTIFSTKSPPLVSVKAKRFQPVKACTSSVPLFFYTSFVRRPGASISSSDVQMPSYPLSVLLPSMSSSVFSSCLHHVFGWFYSWWEWMRRVARSSLCNVSLCPIVHH